MEWGDDGASDPIEEALEAKSFEADGLAVAAAIGQECFVNPNPQVAKQERHGDEHQPQVWIASAGINLRRPHLAVAAFDAKPLAIAVANLGGSGRHAPRAEQELLLHPLAILAVLVRAIGHADPDRDLPLPILQRV